MPPRSMLNASAYPLASPYKWLVFANPRQSRIDPIFAGRLAALACHHHHKIIIVSGFRSYKEQLYFYKICGNKRALKPGSSWHEFGGAVDTTSEWLRRLDNCHLNNQTELLKYGLCKPLTTGNAYCLDEDWHLQPIELAMVTELASKKRFYLAYQVKSRRQC